MQFIVGVVESKNGIIPAYVGHGGTPGEQQGRPTTASSQARHVDEQVGVDGELSGVRRVEEDGIEWWLLLVRQRRRDPNPRRQVHSLVTGGYETRGCFVV